MTATADSGLDARRVDAFLAQLRVAGRRVSTCATYRRRLLRFAAWLAAESLGWDEVDDAVVRDYFDRTGLGASTQRRDLGAIKPFVVWLGRHGHIAPRELRMRVPEMVERETYTPTDAEARAVVRVWRDHPADNLRTRRNAAMVALLIETGMRRSELCRLRVGDVQRRERHVVVEVAPVKGRRVRSVPCMPFDDRGLVMSHYAAQFHRYLTLLRATVGLKPGDPLFMALGPGPMPDGRYPSRDDLANGTLGLRHMGMATVDQVLRDACGLAGIEAKLTPHSLRRYWAVQHLLNGTPLPQLQTLGGWRSLDTMLPYVQQAAIQDEDVAGRGPGRRAALERDHRDRAYGATAWSGVS